MGLGSGRRIGVGARLRRLCLRRLLVLHLLLGSGLGRGRPADRDAERGQLLAAAAVHRLDAVAQAGRRLPAASDVAVDLARGFLRLPLERGLPVRLLDEPQALDLQLRAQRLERSQLGIDLDLVAELTPVADVVGISAPPIRLVPVSVASGAVGSAWCVLRSSESRMHQGTQDSKRTRFLDSSQSSQLKRHSGERIEGGWGTPSFQIRNGSSRPRLRLRLQRLFSTFQGMTFPSAFRSLSF